MELKISDNEQNNIEDTIKKEKLNLRVNNILSSNIVIAKDINEKYLNEIKNKEIELKIENDKKYKEKKLNIINNRLNLESDLLNKQDKILQEQNKILQEQNNKIELEKILKEEELKKNIEENKERLSRQLEKRSHLKHILLANKPDSNNVSRIYSKIKSNNDITKPIVDQSILKKQVFYNRR